MDLRKACRLVFGTQFLLICGLSVGMFIFTGCGGGDAEEDGAEATAKSGTKIRKKKKSGSSSKVSLADSKRKFLEDIPYDVFFDNPLQIASDGTQLANPEGPGGLTPENPPEDDPKPEGGGATNWKDLITAELLKDEIKSIKNTLAGNLQTVGSYNTSYLTIPIEGSVMAVLAQVAIEHPDDISWKENAKFIRVFASSIAERATGSGKKTFDLTKLPFEQVGEILAGSSPAEPPEAEDTALYSEFVEMGILMKRFERIEKWLTTNVGSEDALKSNAEDAVREASVLAVLTKVLMTEGYGYLDDEEFGAFATAMIGATENLKEGATNGDFEKFDMGITVMRKACGECHSGYR